MRRDQAESSCAIQAKLDAILRNSTSQDRPATDRTQGNRVDFVDHNGTNGSQHRYHYPGMQRAQHRGQRRTKSEIDWTLRHAGRRCNAHRDGSGRISTCA